MTSAPRVRLWTHGRREGRLSPSPRDHRPGIGGVDAGAVKLLRTPRRLTGPQREKAGELSLRLAERAVAVR